MHGFIHKFVRPLALGLGLAIGLASSVFAEATFPTKPVRIIVPLPPGNTSEVAVRFLATELQQLTGQPFIIDNKPGGNGLVGVHALLASPADGYTLFFAANGPMAANVSAFKSLGYDPVKDFTPIGMALTSRWTLAVSANSPYKTIDELIAAGRSNPKLISAGVGSTGYQMAAALFAKEAKVSVNIIPYKGVPPAITDTVGDQLTLVIADTGSLRNMVDSNKLRALAVFGEQRSSQFPDVPSLKERGYGSTQLYSWAGLFAPANIPPEVKTRLAALFAEARQKESFRKFVTDGGGEVGTQGSQELASFQKEQVRAYREAMEAAGLEPQ